MIFHYKWVVDNMICLYLTKTVTPCFQKHDFLMLVLVIIPLIFVNKLRNGVKNDK